MAEEDQGRELPHRARRATSADSHPSAPSSAPVLSEELRKRLQAAVKAERAAADQQQPEPGDERTITLPERVPSLTTIGSEERRPAPNRKQKHAAAAKASAQLERIATPVPEDDGTARTGGALKSRVTAKPQAIVEPRPAARHQPASTTSPAPNRPRRRTGALLIALTLAVLVIGSLAVVALKQSSRPPATSSAVLRHEASVREQAAAWVARQVSPGATVACDTAMCAALTAHGFPASKLVTLGPTSPEPVPAVLVVETATVRGLFGSSLATAWAPTVLASFGSGTSGITVRVVAPHGAAAYQAMLGTDLADRKASGSALLSDSQITVSATARSQLAAGLVDSRLVLALAYVAARRPIDIVEFGNLGPGADASVPLRFADLAESVPAARMGTAAYVRAVRADLSEADSRVRPARTATVTVQGKAVLRVEFTAPSPLGLLSNGTS
ncbi:MAG: hypothetical protein JO132_18540 [Streptosporangiaceae bacterium]|nr:hypothetical protein [Streptosporangiaceae bacterium]